MMLSGLLLRRPSRKCLSRIAKSCHSAKPVEPLGPVIDVWRGCTVARQASRLVPTRPTAWPDPRSSSHRFKNQSVAVFRICLPEPARSMANFLMSPRRGFSPGVTRKSYRRLADNSSTLRWPISRRDRSVNRQARRKVVTFGDPPNIIRSNYSCHFGRSAFEQKRLRKWVERTPAHAPRCSPAVERLVSVDSRTRCETTTGHDRHLRYHGSG
jgi:hypothetical protein